ncbi:MAG TPA: RsmB/NOP family class I SAM-dependent RNA methyltransferase [Sphingobacteriaceae bacterium]|nr:RsmB/NOP family class I SAM-dependent RNA methyltransferase [Sphingobacteriaceae bacterium]
MNEKRLPQRLKTFDAIMSAFDRKEPFARFLGQYFKENKQMGSSDRRVASRLTYNFFRSGNAFQEFPVHQRLALGEFLCEEDSNFANLLFPELEGQVNESLENKIKFCEEHFDFNLESLFPLSDSVSDQIDKEAFFRSHFIQPDLFIRIHPGKEANVKVVLKNAKISFQELEENVLAFANGTKLDQVKEIQGKYEVQDYSSQLTSQLFKAEEGESWWDACAGSGGKSIPLMHQQPKVRLMVSDIRNSILRNLDERFTKAGISQYRRKVLDLTKENSILKEEFFDGIILDAPCSGSGTWGRTPEMLTNFDQDKLDHYSSLQKEILDNVIHHLKPGKPLIYITCSVYTQENEQVVQYLEEKGLKLEKMEYFKGYERKGDTLFAARLIK